MRGLAVTKALMVVGTCGLALACSAADPKPEPGLPSSCDPTDRSGSYMVCAELATGDCGSLGCELVNDLSAVPADCILDSENWTDSNCTLERTVTCTDTTTTDVTRTIAVTRQQNEDGSRIEGGMSMQTTTASGVNICSGSYNVTYERTSD